MHNKICKDCSSEIQNFDLSKLDIAQQKAVTHGEGPLLVLAGPGSGKTFTLTQRILYLIRVLSVSPDEILVVTFTKEAAVSMQNRFLETADCTYPVNFGTFHSIFYSILREVSSVNTATIWQEKQKKQVLTKILNNFHKQINQYEQIAEKVTFYLHAISFYKNTGLLESARNKLPEELRDNFNQVLEQYEARRKECSAVDFDDMVYECANILESDKTAGLYWKKRFKHILVDEFQDINPMQYRVLKLLSEEPHNIFAVGDDDQSIYGFRGANPACMRQFYEEYHSERLLLDTNYRSVPEIVSSSLKVIESNKNRFAKKLKAYTDHSDTGILSDKEKRTVQICKFESNDDQYEYIMKQLSTIEPNETIAVLFRTNLHMQSFAARLRKKEIIFEMKEKNVNIYDHFIIKDICAYLRIAAGEQDRSLYLQILNKPNRFISREALYWNASEGSVRNGVSDIFENMKAYYQRNEAVRPSQGSFIKRIENLERQLGHMSSMPLFLRVQYILKVIGYESYLRSKCENLLDVDSHWEEWCSILELIKVEVKEYDTVKQWISYHNKSLRKLSCVETFPSKGKINIQLMTVHASKGLEFDRVIIPDCNEKVFPKGTMPDRECCEEECRIFYVAMTRAKKYLELLYLTGTKERPRLPSRFLNPLFTHLQLHQIHNCQDTHQKHLQPSHIHHHLR